MRHLLGSRSSVEARNILTDYEQERGDNVDESQVFEHLRQVTWLVKTINAGASIHEFQPKKINEVMFKLILHLSDHAESLFLGNPLGSNKINECFCLRQS